MINQTGGASLVLASLRRYYPVQVVRVSEQVAFSAFGSPSI